MKKEQILNVFILESLELSGSSFALSIHGCHYMIQHLPENCFHRSFYVESQNSTGARNLWHPFQRWPWLSYLKWNALVLMRWRHTLFKNRSAWSSKKFFNLQRLLRIEMLQIPCSDVCCKHSNNSKGLYLIFWNFMFLCELQIACRIM